MEPVGVNPQTVDVWSLPTWADSILSNHQPAPPHPAPIHDVPPFSIDNKINKKLCLWTGDITRMNAEAIVHSTNETLNEKSGYSERLLFKAGPKLKNELQNNIKNCKTGEAILTDGFNLPARYIIHTVGPRYNIKYQTAAESALHLCYRRTLECAVEKKMRTVACCVINSVRRSYPPDQGAHIALLFEQWVVYSWRLVLVVDSIDVSIYEILMPLYFPRAKPEEDAASHLLPGSL
ncbi:unnamed protein product, partial [Meganyctiphanes norvegica]